eukprot:9187173-Heterocapsa_arctica.AAC.1
MQHGRFFLELFAGDGGVTRAVLRKGMAAAPAFELRAGSHLDLTLPHVRRLIDHIMDCVGA